MELINKSAVVAEIDRIRKEECPIDSYEGRCKLLWFEQFLSFLDTLEVKEVDTATTEQLIEAAKTVVRERSKFRPLPIYLLEEALESLGINWEE